MSGHITTPLIALTVLFGAVPLSACNTIEGVGEDVRDAGGAVDDAAEEANDDNPKTP